MRSEGPDWYAVIGRVSDGDRLAYLELAALIERFLRRLRAYDFRDEWPDLVQEVVMAVVSAHRGDRFRDPQAALAYVGQTTRFQFLSRLRRMSRRRERDSLEFDDEGSGPALLAAERFDADEAHLDLGRALESIPEPHRSLVVKVYAEGRTYERAAHELGVPLGSAKRYLAQALRELRRLLKDLEDE